MASLLSYGIRSASAAASGSAAPLVLDLEDYDVDEPLPIQVRAQTPRQSARMVLTAPGLPPVAQMLPGYKPPPPPQGKVRRKRKQQAASTCSSCGQVGHRLPALHEDDAFRHHRARRADNSAGGPHLG